MTELNDALSKFVETMTALEARHRGRADPAAILDDAMRPFVNALRDDTAKADTGARATRGQNERVRRDDTPPQRERFPIEDDADRLAAKAKHLGVNDRLHVAMMGLVRPDILEMAYDAGLDAQATEAKAMPEADRMFMQDQRTGNLGIPQAVLDVLQTNLGDAGYQHLIETLTDQAMFGAGTAPRSKAYAPVLVDDPVFGKVKRF